MTSTTLWDCRDRQNPHRLLAWGGLPRGGRLALSARSTGRWSGHARGLPSGVLAIWRWSFVECSWKDGRWHLACEQLLL